MPGRFELTSTLAKIWHAPDHFRLLDPLPPMHRRGIIAGFLLVIIGILLPSDDSQSPATNSREANLNLQSQSQPQAGGNQAVPLPPITNTPTVSDADQMAPVARSRFRTSSQIRRRRSSLLPNRINPRSSSPHRALSSSGGPIASSQAKPWPSCSAIMGCRPPTSTRWRRLKALANH
ncbi:putative cell envelope opacity-associated protein A [Klebsiella variicola]|uniref:Putative cell envelope opacity-associated protein A n=1 Tax=Klebsiella variicola TaxID=244366 RepID=A0A7H4MBY6_KLEVA|nr:putative cell envelope opacity-associated protein A [Klebsiella variicola]